MLRLAALFGLLGLAAATGLIIWSGFDQVIDALSRAGWGILWTSLYHIVSMVLCIIGWRALMTDKKRPSHLFMLYVLWLRSSVNNLMPVARIGGEFVAVRVMTKHGYDRDMSIASTIVELTMSVLAVFLFDATGIGLFTHYVAPRDMGWQLLMGLLISIPAIAALVIVQRAGFFGLLSKIFSLMFRGSWTKFAGSAAALDEAVHAMYRKHGRVLICGFWQLLAWISGIGEIWLALHFLGHTTSLGKAFMLEALIQASASAGFAVPGALGVQEAGFLLFGHMLGLAPDIAAAMAVIRRCRDIILFVPGLIVWQMQEGRWLLGKKRA
ncbi:MAG TPA: lysylphosphatidylglycerol synthase domain-containing protein [Alphaproteobacteria bacterium]|nr:lysylphosphatidylglycerol synthase domain-containing protein [Alphaproteobacteria bacterium]